MLNGKLLSFSSTQATQDDEGLQHMPIDTWKGKKSGKEVEALLLMMENKRLIESCFLNILLDQTNCTNYYLMYKTLWLLQFLLEKMEQINWDS